MTGAGTRTFIEADSCQRAKHGQLISGDVILSEKIKEEGRVVTVLSDGLGSGVKASVLATLTATMALKYTSSAIDIRKSAEIIMDTLPICSVRGISYSTFTIVDVDPNGTTRIIEHGNPPYLIVRPESDVAVEKTEIRLKRWQDRLISYSCFQAQLHDRVIFFSDGVTQAGTGEYRTPLGWGLENVEGFVRERIRSKRDISARELSRTLVSKAEEIDGLTAKDDITCGIIYFRQPRELLVMTGAPFNRERDHDLARMAREGKGRKVICGGTTANIVSRLLGREIKVDLRQRLDPKIPPMARMDGIDLVTEGTLTLGEVLALLEKDAAIEKQLPNAATKLAALLVDSDIVRFAVGTRINDAHQDPNIPVELDLRRNLVKRIAEILETKHLKQVSIQYL